MNQPMTTEEFAQATWCREFQQLLNGVELTYHAWMRAQDAQRANKKPEKSAEFGAQAQERRIRYNQAVSELQTWLRSHPSPAWKATAKPAPDWKAQEKALGIALMAILKREPTAEEFEQARSLYHYSLGQFEEVVQAVAEERKAAKADSVQIGQPA